MERNGDPFTPRTALTRAVLERYAQGGLSPAERHEVELHLERDPLLRDAVEGWGLPGALSGMGALPAVRKRLPWRSWGAGILVAVLGVGGVLLLTRPDQAPDAAARHKAPAAGERGLLPAAVESTLQVVHHEIEALPELSPAALPPAPAAEKFHQRPVAAVRETLDPIARRPTGLAGGSAASRAALKQAARSSRQLVFLHGLKVVHPAELHRPGAALLPSPGVPANAGTARNDSIPSGPGAIPYLEYMDQALGAFARGAYPRTLDDLYALLGQDPADVNAQFYAGLACYRLGIYPRALRLFERAGANPVDSFREEAQWYRALTLAHTAGADAAQEAFARIAQEGGFYAAQARQRMAQPGAK